MSIKQYIEYRQKKKNRVTNQAITKALRLNHKVPGLISHSMYGGTYVLQVDIEELNNFLVAIKKPIKLQVKK